MEFFQDGTRNVIYTHRSYLSTFIIITTMTLIFPFCTIKLKQQIIFATAEAVHSAS